MSDRYDVIVIGAGHNGLTTAALLAQRGRRVLVVERRPRVGGLAAGEEFHPGYRTIGVLHDSGRVRRRVVDQLGLQGHGLEFRYEPAPTLLPETDGDGLLLHHDPERAADELSKRSPDDVEKYREYRAFLDRIAPILGRLREKAAPDIFDIGLGDMVHLGRTALSLRMLGKEDMMDILRIAPMCVADWLNEWFSSELLKAALAAPGLEGCFAGPWSPGTNANLLWMECSCEGQVAGGPGALVEALEKAAVAAGAEIRCGTAVEAVTLTDGKVSAVVAGGETIETAAVAASCDPRHLFLDLLPSFELTSEFERNISNYRVRGTAAKVNIAVSSYPEFSCRPGLQAERVWIGETIDDLERAFDPVKYRQFSRRPALDIRVPTVANAGLAPPGHHVLSILVHCAPYELEGGWTDEAREELGNVVVDRIAEYAPGIGDAIVGRQVLTPLDLEATYGTTGGHLFHGEHAVDQLVVRPIPGCTGYRTPFEGLHLCGSGSHPGGGITCAPGALAAGVILRG